MTFGEDPGGAGCSVEESERILSAYLERGGNFIDTANFYTHGHSEKILGDYLAARSGQREHVILASKFFTNMYPGDPNGGGVGRGSIELQLNQTLRRLRTAWVTAQAQTLAILKSWTPVIGLQVEYSLLARTVEGEIAPLAVDQGMSLVAWSPLKNGFLSGKYGRGTDVTDSARTPFVGGPGDAEYVVIDAVAKVAEELGTTSGDNGLAQPHRLLGHVPGEGADHAAAVAPTVSPGTTPATPPRRRIPA